MNPHPLTSVFGVVTLLVVSIASGLIGQSRSSHPLSWSIDWSHSVEAQAADAGVPVVDAAEVQTLIDSGERLILDARKLEEFDAGHIPMAMSLPESDFENAYLGLADFLQPETPLLVYCGGKDCDDALLVSLRLRESGSTNVVLFAGGYAAWTGEGRDVE